LQIKSSVISASRTSLSKNRAAPLSSTGCPYQKEGNETVASDPHQPTISADEALQRLTEGNNRFLEGSARFPTVCKETLADLARGQQPYATILGCSDSRVPPELIFDADFGELFIIRVAGNVISPEVMGSMQYAGAHLHTPLFVVLGHEGCGAVEAAVESKLNAVEHQSRIQILVNNILPGLPDFDPQAAPQDRLAQAVEANVRWSMHQLLETPEGKRAVQEERAKLAGAVYEIATGRVRFLE
jgi:carbonic anhydrase